MRDTITKSDWLTAGQCLTMAWFGLRADPRIIQFGLKLMF